MKRFVVVALLCVISALQVAVAENKLSLSSQEKPVYESIKTLRSVSDKDRPKTTSKLAMQIRDLPNSENKVTLATALASLSTEGDFGLETLQAWQPHSQRHFNKRPCHRKRGSLLIRMWRSRNSNVMNTCR